MKKLLKKQEAKSNKKTKVISSVKPYRYHYNNAKIIKTYKLDLSLVYRYELQRVQNSMKIVYDGKSIHDYNTGIN